LAEPGADNTTTEAAERIVAASEELADLSNHATHVCTVVDAAETDSASVSKLLERIDALEPNTPGATFDTPTVQEQVRVPSLAQDVLSWFLTHIVEHVDEPAIRLTVTVKDTYVQLDADGEGPCCRRMTPSSSRTARRRRSDTEATWTPHGRT
jgi:hypothetical protein